MSVSAPERPREGEDLFEGLPGPAGGPAWVAAVIDAARTDPTGEPLRAALDARLGPPADRREKRARLDPHLSDRNLLLTTLSGAITVGDGAAFLTLNIRNAVRGGTSRDVLEQAIGPLLSVLGPPSGPVVNRVQSGPARDAIQRVPTSAATHQPPGSRPGPVESAYDPQGPFRIPDRAVHCAQGLIAAPLFPRGEDARGPGPVRVPRALPPPPEGRGPDAIRAWLRGEPVLTDSLGVRAGLIELGDPGDLMEIESEFHTDPAAALRLYRARDPVADGTADAAWCARLGFDLGRFGVTHERAVGVLSEALARQLAAEPDRSGPLMREGAVLTVREELAEAVCGLIDAEADYLSDGPSDPSGPPQNLMGSFSPNADLSRGRCLDRALFLHLNAGVPLGGALRQSLTEFRLAQAVRANPAAPSPELDRRYERDPALPLAELSGLVPIIRIGYTEPVLT